MFEEIFLFMKKGVFLYVKGQVTVFVILGFVLFIMVAFFLAAINSLGPSGDSVSDSRRAIETELDSITLNYYIYSCLDSVVNEEIFRFAKSGGFLTDGFEAGVNSIPFNVSEDEIVNVSYGVGTTFKDVECDIVEESPPEYPLYFTYLHDLYGEYRGVSMCSRYPDFGEGSGFFGLVNLSRLCIQGSPNLENIPGFGVSPCSGNRHLNEDYTVEHVLSERIQNGLDECVNRTMLYEISDQLLSLSPDRDISVEIIFNSQSFTAIAEFPFTSLLGDGDVTVISKNYSYSSHLRITRLHNYVLSLLSADNLDVFFNLSRDYSGVERDEHSAKPRNVEDFYSSSFDVKVHNFLDCDIDNPVNDCDKYRFDRILEVSDSSSKYFNDSLTFRIGIKNRRPALDLIHEFSTSFRDFNIISAENEEIIIDPWGYDPDDWPVTYNYSGWKETYDESCEIVGENIVCDRDYSVEPRNWTTSDLFIDTNRSASFTPNSSDLGPHNVTVIVTDYSGKSDWQTVKILVFDLPLAVITPKPVYPDVPNFVYSVEDPFVLSGEGSAVSEWLNNSWPSELSNFSWEVYGPNDLNNFLFSDSLSGPNIPMPPHIELPNPKNLLDIHERDFKNAGQYLFNLVVSQNVLEGPLQGVPINSNPVNQEVTVKQCIPFSHQEPVFPYGHQTVDGFGEHNHACCGGNLDDPTTYTLLGSNTNCHSETWYGEYYSLLDKLEELEMSAVLQDYVWPPKYSGDKPSDTHTNGRTNVYRLSFDRACDGERGNICAGDITANIDVEFPGTSQCIGPPKHIVPTATNHIINYEYETFYSIFENGPNYCSHRPNFEDICSNEDFFNVSSEVGKYHCEYIFCKGGSCSAIDMDESNCVCRKECPNSVCTTGETHPDPDDDRVCDPNTCKWVDT